MMAAMGLWVRTYVRTYSYAIAVQQLTTTHIQVAITIIDFNNSN